MSPRFEPAIGRYLHLDLLGRPHRLYVEEAGEGIPLLCLHTAGSDGRQYRGLLNDERITRDYRVIVFDMPWHGKSSPPAGWENEDYRLTSRDYVRMILEVSQALELAQSSFPILPAPATPSSTVTPEQKGERMELFGFSRIRSAERRR